MDSRINTEDDSLLFISIAILVQELPETLKQTAQAFRNNTSILKQLIKICERKQQQKIREKIFSLLEFDSSDTDDDDEIPRKIIE